jgi:hypothetical protein
MPEAAPWGSQRSRQQAGTKGRDATARSDRVDQVVAGPGVVAPWPSIPEAAPWGSRRSRTAAGTRQRNETAHFDHALRQVTPPFVPSPSSARMAAPRAMRSRHSSPVRCSPTAALRCGLRGVHDRARVFATPASRLRVHGDVPASACAPLLSVCSTERQPQRRGARSGPTPHPRPQVPVTRVRRQIEIYYFTTIVCFGRMYLCGNPALAFVA